MKNGTGTHLPELLAPAGSCDAFFAAVSAGADAVYLSGKRFGARRSAPNFTDAELEKAIGYAHCRNVRVYVTVNTLIHDSELDAIAEYLIWLYSIGADAVLVQDIGVAALARDIVPFLPLHASTQMTLHTSAGVRWAAQQGFSRVVLARELSLPEITRIAQETGGSGIGLEVFVHGALCYCYSGQCLLSSVIGNRSGNRGMCAQPCRKPYTLVRGDTDQYGLPTEIHEVTSTGRYLLSPKDLCTYEYLGDLVGSPVKSLKLEGRMKSPEYVAIVVSTYRKALDAIASGEDYKSPESAQDLFLAFNRGLTPGYLFGKRDNDIMGTEAPDNRGMCIGIVIRYDTPSKTAVVRLSSSLVPRPGDGLMFSHPEHPGQEFGFSLNTSPDNNDGRITFRVPHRVEPGTQVFITSSCELGKRARQIISHPPSGLRHPVPLDVSVRINTAGRVVIEGTVYLTDRKEIPVICQPAVCFVPARDHPTSREQVEQNLKKTGGTPYTFRNFTLAYDGCLFIPLAGLNRIRREFLALVKERIQEDTRPSQENVLEAYTRWNSLKPRTIIPVPPEKSSGDSVVPSLGVYADSLPGVRGSVEGGCDVIFFEPPFIPRMGTCGKINSSPFPVSEINTALAYCRESGVKLILKFPRITKDAWLDEFLSVLAQGQLTGISGYMVDQPGTAQTLKQAHTVLYGSTGLNVFNYAAVRHLTAWFDSLTLSPELSGNEIRRIIHTARISGCTTLFSLIVQGPVEAMVSENCILRRWISCPHLKDDPEHPPFYGIRDATGHIFPVRVDSECRSHIYNSAELCLIDHLPSLMQDGVNEIIIDVRHRTHLYALDMCRIYRQALVKAGTLKEIYPSRPLKDAVKRLTMGGITAGPYIHGLQEEH